MYSEKIQASAEIKEIIETKRINAEKSYSEWLDLFNELKEIDLEIEKDKKRHGRKLADYCFLFSLSFFAGLFTIELTYLRILLIVPLYLLVKSIFHLSKFRHYRKIDMENDFRKTIEPLLQEFKGDLDQSEKIKINLDLTNISQHRTSAKKVSDSQNNLNYTTTCNSEFKQPVFKLVFKLKNSARYVVEVGKAGEATTHKIRGKRNSGISSLTYWRLFNSIKVTIITPVKTTKHEKKVRVSANINQLPEVCASPDDILDLLTMDS